VLGVLSLSSGAIAGIFSILGMLQVGPLQDLLYKGSVSVRGYYWRAGIEMFQQNPLMGVGMDRYGAYFKEYREVGYPLAYGFDITSSNAHNTFIQFFATGGFLLGTTYLLLNGFILWRGIAGVRQFTGNNRLLITGLLAAWVAFHSQSLISIDNIGVSIWGWVLGGSIIGLSVSDPESVSCINICVFVFNAVATLVPHCVISILVLCPLYFMKRRAYISPLFISAMMLSDFNASIHRIKSVPELSVIQTTSLCMGW
jgi:hypothetical protein